jgi:hypothetical protein
MSDLEDRGIIDSNQKGVLKDLIISGDDELMIAVEKYEKGDTKALEAMIKSGAFKKRNASDIDILGDLDLDFLSMNEDFVGAGDESVVSGGGGGGGGTGGAKSLPMQIRTRRRSFSENSNLFMQSHSHGGDSDVDANNSMRGTSPAPVHQGGSYDGIGDLEFNADYSQGGGGNNTTDAVQHLSKLRADSIIDLQRNRANSLAFGSLLDESNHEAVDSVGKWMDRAPIMQEMRKMPLKKRVSSQIVGANGGLYIINNKPSDSSAPTEKLTAAQIKRKEREERKAIKEREKLEKKLQKEREKQLKKEAREKKKAAKSPAGRKKKTEKAAKAEKEEPIKVYAASDQFEAENNDEPKVIVSGTGRPRSLSDPNLSIYLDANGLMQIDHPPDWVGAYSPESRKIRIDRFLAKRDHRVWVKKVKYDVRKNFADSRLRVKGRFVKKEDELLMRDLMGLT